MELDRAASRITFLSTLSLRRATAANSLADAPPQISIHALLAESDQLYINRAAKAIVFLSTLSLRRATKIDPVQVPG